MSYDFATYDKNYHTEADVVVIGAGIFGLSTAYFLSKMGKKVIVVEKKDVGSGASGSNEAWVWLSTRTREVLPFVRFSQQFYTNIEETIGYDVEYNNCGGYIIAESQEEMDFLAKYCEQRWKDGLPEIHMIGQEEFHKRERGYSPHVMGGTYNPLDGCVNSILVCVGFASAVRDLGNEVWTKTDITAINLKGKKVHEVVTNRGTIRTDCVVNAAGSWAADIGKLVNVDVPCKPERMTVLVSEPVAPYINNVSMTGKYLLDELNKAEQAAAAEAGEAEASAVYVYTQMKKGNLLLGSTEDFVGYDRRVNFENPKAIAKVIGDINPEIRDKKVNIIRAFANFFPFTMDNNPIMGPVPGVEGFVMATGLNGGGMAIGIGAGYTTAQYCAFKETHFRIDYFDIQRESLWK